MLLKKCLMPLVSAIILFASVVAAAEEGAALLNPKGGATLLNPNSAASEELGALPHLSESLVAAIVDGRPYSTMGDLNSALSNSLGDEQLEELYEKLFIPINLNTASEADILLIPRVGKRMAHEFEEYRPYQSMQQFRREIGKYVDAEEVARLETYVTLD